MGLDMYLERRTYVQRWDHIPADKQFSVSVTRGGKPYEGIKSDRVSYVIEQVAYWRKANAIHKWFVDKVQDGRDDCQSSYVEESKLRELLDLVNGVLEGRDLGEDVLPTQSGFFFGSTDYDEWYKQDLLLTKRQLEAVLAEDNSEASFYYQASW